MGRRTVEAQIPASQPEGRRLSRPDASGEAATGSCRDVSWRWRNQDIRLTRCDGPAGSLHCVLLIHGFGASRRHWRHTFEALAQEAEVIALDLLGFGLSAKPPSHLADEPPSAGSVQYGIDLWAHQVRDAARCLASPGRRLHLIGNSIGAVVALRAAELLSADGHPPAQVILIDCAQRTLDDKRLNAKPPWARATRPLLKAAVRQRWLIGPLFRLVAQPAQIRAVLRQAYPSGAGVDPALIRLLHEPSQEPGAIESFRGFINLFDDHLAPDLLARLTVPVRMLWGEADPWEDVNEARRWAETYRCIQDLVVLPGVGHCPHDEAPEQVNPILRRWLKSSLKNPATSAKMGQPSIP
ncbi:MAG: alpha/beta fold hydrolase [Cyanobacteriota bacterium]